LRERWLADPRFLQRLAIEESISITTTLFAQYKTRGDRFWRELEYVITDTVRAVAVDFFTVWLPAPTLSFRSLDSQVSFSCTTVDGIVAALTLTCGLRLPIMGNFLSFGKLQSCTTYFQQICCKRSHFPPPISYRFVAGSKKLPISSQ